MPRDITITLTLPCRDDVPDDVVDWMASHLAQFARQEFADVYDPTTWHTPSYVGPPMIGGNSTITWTWQTSGDEL